MSLPVHINLDVDQMRSCMGLWRESLVIASAARASDEDRRDDVTRVGRALDGWLDLLQLCSAEGAEQQRLADIQREVVEFREWTRQAGLALSLLADQRNTALLQR